ncbi:Mitogen-activated protein kinase [Fasciola hepatica]|uniref:mitogen-activated protein kinase n=1 Tax=Fasciola hepatica TaxID=6192 RepID=A0A4E0RTP7_FASHE|nr:Mitogen-activated protein kinase [Fasciola hepatica]
MDACFPFRPSNSGHKPGFVQTELNLSIWLVPERYQDLTLLGHGAYGVVCTAYDTRLQRRVAIKKLTKPFEDKEYAKRTHRELKILSHVDHENILCLIDAFSPQTSLEQFKDVYLVTPLMGADLEAVIRSQSLSDGHIRFLVYQILRALKYMHSAGLVHRDLKPVNIAVNEDCELKILDFGLARRKDEVMTGYVTTRWYRAPEIMLNWMHYNESVDIWSTACIMAELRTRKPLFTGKNHIDQIKMIMRVLGKPDEECMKKITSQNARDFVASIAIEEPQDLYTYFAGFSPDAIDLLQKLLHLDPDRRYTATQALAHPYFQGYHDDQDEPVGEPFIDPLEDRTDVSLEEWKKHVWNALENFVPKLDSLKLSSLDNVTESS